MPTPSAVAAHDTLNNTGAGGSSTGTGVTRTWGGTGTGTGVTGRTDAEDTTDADVENGAGILKIAGAPVGTSAQSIGNKQGKDALDQCC